MKARRILSMDGGGIRGLVTCRWLVGVEDALQDAGKPGLLVLQGTIKTYRYLDDEEVAAAAAGGAP